MFSHTETFDLLVANPDVLQMQSMLTYLETKTDPMPANMINSLQNIPFTPTDRTFLESDIAWSFSRMATVAGKLTHLYLRDQTLHNSDSVRVWFTRQESMESTMAVVDSWLNEGNTIDALEVLNDIPINHELSVDEQLEFGYFLNLKQLQMNLINQELDWASLTQEEIATMENIATQGQGLARLQARNILNAHFGNSFYDEPLLPSIGQNRIGYQIQRAINSQIMAFPNPASDHVQFHIKPEKDLFY